MIIGSRNREFSEAGTLSRIGYLSEEDNLPGWNRHR
jgi:hypothetical protein